MRPIHPLFATMMTPDTVVIDFEDMSIEKADSQIQILQHYIQKLRLARNAVLPIHRLPPEILLAIFALVETKWKLRAPRSVLKLTWVSHHWRELAIGCPQLWDVITNANLPWASEWLARSGSVPLSVGLYGMRAKDAEASMRQLRSIFLQAPRMKMFHCMQNTKPTLVLSKSFWKTPAPLLRSLRLDGVILNGNILSAIPNVKEVHLTNCQFPWEPSADNYPHLTSLNIAHPLSTVSVNQLIRLIHKMPSLEWLELIGVFASDGHETSVVPPLQLPRLFMLNLDFDKAIDSSLRFLRYAISRFMTDRTIIFCSSDHTTWEDGDDLPHLLTSFSQIISPGEPVAISLSSADKLNINYQSVEEDICRMTLFVAIDEEHHLPLLSTLQHSITLTHLRAVKLESHMPEWSASSIVQVFGQLPDLHYFYFRPETHTLFNFLLALSHEDEQSTLSFTSLKHFGCLTNEGAYSLLSMVLNKRKRLGYGLETVILDSGYERWKCQETILEDAGKLVNFVAEGSVEASDIEAAEFLRAESFYSYSGTRFIAVQ